MKMKKNSTYRSKAFEVPLYGSKFVVSVAPNINILKEKVSTDIDIGDSKLHGACTLGSYKGYAAQMVSFNLFRDDSPITHGDISHECLHATNNISKWVNLPKDQSEDEPTAYLIKWMVNTVYKCLNEWGVYRLIK